MSIHSPCRAILRSLDLQGNFLRSNFKFNHGVISWVGDIKLNITRNHCCRRPKQNNCQQSMSHPQREWSPFLALSHSASCTLCCHGPAAQPQEGNRAEMDVSPKGSDPNKLPSDLSIWKFSVQAQQSFVWRTCFSSLAAFKL